MLNKPMNATSCTCPALNAGMPELAESRGGYFFVILGRLSQNECFD